MVREDEKISQIDKIRDESEIKMEETVLKANEKKFNAKIRFQEKRLEIKESINKRKLDAHINLAEVKIDEAYEDANVEIEFLVDEIVNQIADGEPADLILFKSDHILEEICLRTQLKIQIAKNELIANLQNDFEDSIKVAILEEKIAILKEKTDHVIGTLEGKIATEKEELSEKYAGE